MPQCWRSSQFALMVIKFIDMAVYINSIKCKAKWKKKTIFAWDFFFLKQIHIVNSTTFNVRNNGAMILWIVTGVGGNLVAIQASRMSTYLHCWSAPGTLPSKMNGNCPRPCATFCSTGQKKLLFCFPCTEKPPSQQQKKILRWLTRWVLLPSLK